MEGQKKLKAARVLAVGAGGLGSPLALYLAAAGVGTIGLVDFDVVDASNLQRQVLFGTTDVGRPKLAAAAERLPAINPHVRIVPFEERLTSENALEIVRDFDIVADGTDNFPTRYLVNDACVLTGKAERLRLDLPLRGAGLGLLGGEGALLPLPLSPSRRRRASSRRAPKGACSASCRDSSGSCRPPRRSSSILGAGRPAHRPAPSRGRARRCASAS